MSAVEVIIREIDLLNLQDADRCDAAFSVDARLVLRAEDGIIRYTVVGTPLYQKRYPLDEIDYAAYIGNPDKTVYFAHVDDRVAG